MGHLILWKGDTSEMLSVRIDSIYNWSCQGFLFPSAVTPVLPSVYYCTSLFLASKMFSVPWCWSCPLVDVLSLSACMKTSLFAGRSINQPWDIVQRGVGENPQIEVCQACSSVHILEYGSNIEGIWILLNESTVFKYLTPNITKTVQWWWDCITREQNLRPSASLAHESKSSIDVDDLYINFLA